jgi:ribosome-binding factor A
MSNRRVERINELLREEISLLIMTEVKDPRINNIVTIVAVSTSTDLRRATVYFSSLDNESDQGLTSTGLNSSAGFLRKKLRERLSLRHIPELEFQFDDSIQTNIRLSQLIDSSPAS